MYPPHLLCTQASQCARTVRVYGDACLVLYLTMVPCPRVQARHSPATAQGGGGGGGIFTWSPYTEDPRPVAVETQQKVSGCSERRSRHPAIFHEPNVAWFWAMVAASPRNCCHTRSWPAGPRTGGLDPPAPALRCMPAPGHYTINSRQWESNGMGDLRRMESVRLQSCANGCVQPVPPSAQTHFHCSRLLTSLKTSPTVTTRHHQHHQPIS